MITLRKRKVFMSDISPDCLSIKTRFIIEIKDEHGQFCPFADKGQDLYHETPEARNVALEAVTKKFQDTGAKVKVLK